MGGDEGARLAADEPVTVRRFVWPGVATAFVQHGTDIGAVFHGEAMLGRHPPPSHAAVPEPASLLMLLIGAAMLVLALGELTPFHERSGS